MDKPAIWPFVVTVIAIVAFGGLLLLMFLQALLVLPG